MTKRSIVSVVLLSIFTCGIYTIYWMYVTTEELNDCDPSEPLMNYILAILLSIVTCGIYGIYWQYKFYQKMDRVCNTSNLVLNFILSLIGFGLVSTAIAQDGMNNIQ